MRLIPGPKSRLIMIYMDNAATTRVTDEVFEAMRPCLTEVYGNPSSVHAAGRRAKKALEQARRSVAAALGADAREIYFTSGGSEADSWALFGAAYAPGNTRRTLITTRIEHKAVLNAARELERRGFSVKYLDVNAQGQVDEGELANVLSGDTFLVSVMAANNETGAVQNIERFCAMAHEAGALFHTDAVQAAGARAWKLDEMGIDLFSLSGHKLHAPKGVGALYVREGVSLSPVIFGGAQERGKRGGTENLASAVGLGRALEICRERLSENLSAKQALTKRLEEGILSTVEGTRVNAKTLRVPGISSITFDGVDGEALLLNLDLKGIMVSAGSACTSGSVDPSHVLLAMGLDKKSAMSTVRFSLSEENTPQEVDEAVRVTGEIVDKLRRMKAGKL